MANYLLVKEAAPRANTLLSTLIGTDGKSGMVANQRKLLATDVEQSLSRSNSLITLLWLLLFLSLGLSVVIVLLTAGSITKPITAMTRAMKTLASGDTSVDIPNLDRKDEIGTMAESVNVFKLNAIERTRLEQESKAAEQAQLQREQDERETAAAQQKAEAERERAEVAEGQARANRGRRPHCHLRKGSHRRTQCCGLVFHRNECHRKAARRHIQRNQKSLRRRCHSIRRNRHQRQHGGRRRRAFHLCTGNGSANEPSKCHLTVNSQRGLRK
ncbi:MAG: HAMP domain-containing protein [Candidatus Reddybacter sp.]